MTDIDTAILDLNDNGLPPGFLQTMDRKQLGALITQVMAVLDDLDETGEESPRLPLMMGGHIHNCSRCGRSTTITTWRVVAYADNGAARDVCPRCAEADPELRIWQSYCDITQAIDGLMRVAGSKQTRRDLAQCLQNTVSNFSMWRWTDDDTAA